MAGASGGTDGLRQARSAGRTAVGAAGRLGGRPVGRPARRSAVPLLSSTPVCLPTPFAAGVGAPRRWPAASGVWAWGWWWLVAGRPRRHRVLAAGRGGCSSVGACLQFLAGGTLASGSRWRRRVWRRMVGGLRLWVGRPVVAAGGGGGRRRQWPAVGSVGGQGLHAVQAVYEEHASRWVCGDVGVGGSSWSGE